MTAPLAFPPRVLLTGCSGTLGTVLRPFLQEHCAYLRLSDLVAPKEALATNEQFVACDLGDRDGMVHLLKDIDAVVHMGGTANEYAADVTLQANVMGVFNLYHAALENGVRRVALASSNHVTGYYRTEQPVNTESPLRPDSLYAVSKGFGELLSRYYYDHHGIETVAMRIGTCRVSPDSHRALLTWLSHRDFRHLVERALCAPEVGHAVVYGVSDNPGKWWSSADAQRIGFAPRDSAAAFAEEVARVQPPYAADNPLRIWQGGVMSTYDYRRPRLPKDRP